MSSHDLIEMRTNAVSAVFTRRWSSQYAGVILPVSFHPLSPSYSKSSNLGRKESRARWRLISAIELLSSFVEFMDISLRPR